ncbi:MAG TPA: ATP-binding protein [Thermoplasmata archaeon]|nr:ATP-binding protein [Thermoplasmata archaeon]
MAGERPKTVVSWSSGKDAAFALWEVQRQGELDVVALLTTVTSEFDRVSMHGVRVALLERQAAAVGLPLWKVEIPFPCPNEVYEAAMARAVEHLAAAGVSRIVFGDLFLEDVRTYRERRLEPTGIRPAFPLWGRKTDRLAEEMLRSGLEARVVCLDPRKLPREFAGRPFDAAFLRELPRSVDPCGERGEFHTFVTAGPMFSRPIAVLPGETVERDGFVFSDLAPG